MMITIEHLNLNKLMNFYFLLWITEHYHYYSYPQINSEWTKQFSSQFDITINNKKISYRHPIYCPDLYK